MDKQALKDEEIQKAIDLLIDTFENMGKLISRAQEEIFAANQKEET